MPDFAPHALPGARTLVEYSFQSAEVTVGRCGDDLHLLAILGLNCGLELAAFQTSLRGEHYSRQRPRREHA